jgi:ATP-binding cassette subfamily B (MDR/TAP) protein 1
MGAFIAGSAMPLFALGVSQALVAYYMDWDTTRHEVKKIAILFCCGAAISVIVYAVEHLSFGIMGERLTLRVREMMFSGNTWSYFHQFFLTDSFHYIMRRKPYFYMHLFP